MLKKIANIFIICLLISFLIVLCLQRFYNPIKQSYQNNKIIKNKSKYTIICLGESLTQGGYPIQLQKFLDEKYPNKFSVIDCSVSGAHLAITLDLLDKTISQYKPDIAICMMGIIDDNNKKSGRFFYSSSRLYNLYSFFRQRFFDKDLYDPYKFENKISKFCKYIRKLKIEHKIEKARKIITKRLEENNYDEEAFFELTDLYFYCLRDKDLGYKMAQEAIEKKLQYRKESYYRIIFEYNNENLIDSKFYIDEAIKDGIFSIKPMNYLLYGYVKDILSSEQKNAIIKAMVMTDKNDFYYGFLAIDAIKSKDYQKAEEYFNKAEEIRLKYRNFDKEILYKQIVEKLLSNNIKVICMQYPMRSIKPLQEQLKEESYYDKITFISNERNFKDMLKIKSYDEIFNDHFSIDFGHCTDLGNIMIVENILKTLENNIIENKFEEY